ncbi:MAG: hypothetical protein ACFCUJ_06585 [Thiotrichales bacterium]
MSEPQPSGVLLTHSSLSTYFHESVQDALTHQQVTARDDTTHYLADLLTQYARVEQLFDHTEHGLRLRALAQIYADAVEAPHERERYLFLRRLGDVALFVSGLFAGTLARKPIDVDYYIAMGRGAYSSLSDLAPSASGARTQDSMFGELARDFVRFVDVFAEVSERAPWNRNLDIMRMWEIWHKTGSPRLERKLRSLGVTLTQPAYVG